MPNAFRQGDHICSIYDTEEEQLATAAAYLADGFRRGDRCLYVADSAAAMQRLRTALSACGVDAGAQIERGALLELTHSEAHLIDGHFDCERMLALLEGAVAQALEQGFSGLCACGDMSWLLADAPGSDQVLEYEALLNEFFSTVPGAAMCQYNRTLLAQRFVDVALITHSTAVVNGTHKFNPFYQTPPEDGGASTRRHKTGGSATTNCN
jgi:hypothetical protein